MVAGSNETVTEEYLRALFSSTSVTNKDAVVGALLTSTSQLMERKFGELKKNSFEEKIITRIKLEDSPAGIQRPNRAQKEKLDKVKVLKNYTFEFFQKLKKLGNVELRKIIQIISTMWELKVESL